ncbi:hypothetical protein GOP47_0028631 [Adiantum capillus-veneris]|nr:hypothetical protein GOP47_0028631 [Adiantum capillus-veneris]
MRAFVVAAIILWGAALLLLSETAAAASPFTAGNMQGHEEEGRERPPACGYNATGCMTPSQAPEDAASARSPSGLVPQGAPSPWHMPHRGRRHPRRPRRRRSPSPMISPTPSPAWSKPLWCIAKPDASEDLLVAGLFHVCYQKAGFYCLPLLPGGSCFAPNVPRPHASFAFNSFWQFHRDSGFPCDFDGAAHLVSVDPSTSFSYNYYWFH